MLQTDVSPHGLLPFAKVRLVKPGCFSHGSKATLRKWLPYSKVYAVRLERGGIVFARADQLIPLL
jgi:hypothetical protein